jgi:hypothetical protein
MSAAPHTIAQGATARPPAGGAAARAREWLRRTPRRHLALGALVPLLVALWLPILTGSAPADTVAARLADPAAAAAVPAAPATEAATRSLATATIGATAAFEQRVRELTKPFRPRWQALTPTASDPGPKPADAPAVSYSALVPTAILLSRGGEPVAIIQGLARKVGDVVAGSTIVAIEERRVVYREGGRTVAADMASTALGGRDR